MCTHIFYRMQRYENIKGNFKSVTVQNQTGIKMSQFNLI